MKGEMVMSNKLKSWIKAAGIRAIKTFAQTAASLITVGQMITSLDWKEIICVSLTSAVLSILTSLGGLPEVEDEQNE